MVLRIFTALGNLFFDSTDRVYKYMGLWIGVCSHTSREHVKGQGTTYMHSDN